MGIDAGQAQKLLLYVALVSMATFLMSFATFITVFFDQGVAPGPSPIPSPTPPPVAPVPEPTPSPTDAPTKFPTPFPTLSPTAAQVCDITGVELGAEYFTEGGYMSIIFTSCPTQRAFVAFLTAANRWESFIAENTLTPVDFGREFDVADGCGFLSSFIISPGVSDHLIIIAETSEIDGPGGGVAGSSPCLAEASFLPIFGGIQFDNADTDALDQAGILEDVIAHEIGHVLGFIRILFQLAAPGGGQAPAGPDGDLIDDDVFAEDGSTNYGNQPKFTGSNAVSIYNELFGVNETSVPLEDGFVGGEPLFDPDTNTGAGIIDSHWDKEVFGNELMTYALSLDADSRPVSSVTLAALADLGYTVDLSVAEPFSVPEGPARANKGRKFALKNDLFPALTEIRLAEEVLKELNP